MEIGSGRTETVFGRLCDNCCIRQAGRQAGPHTKYSIVVCASFSSRFISSLSSISPPPFVLHLLFQSVAFFFTFCPRALHFRILFIVFHLLPVVIQPLLLFFPLHISLTFSFFYLKLCHYYYYSHWPRIHGMYLSACVCVSV